MSSYNRAYSALSSMQTNRPAAFLSEISTEYGPIKIRRIRKPAPTIATGRRSKHLVLAGDEAIKREQRREKNREAARKLKEKRQLIEDELDRKLKELQGEHAHLQTHLQQLQQRKGLLEHEVTNLSHDPLEELLSDSSRDVWMLYEQYLNHGDTRVESAEEICRVDVSVDGDCKRT